jgi:hypothetical protein
MPAAVTAALGGDIELARRYAPRIATLGDDYPTMFAPGLLHAQAVVAVATGDDASGPAPVKDLGPTVLVGGTADQTFSRTVLERNRRDPRRPACPASLESEPSPQRSGGDLDLTLKPLGADPHGKEGMGNLDRRRTAFPPRPSSRSIG